MSRFATCTIASKPKGLMSIGSKISFIFITDVTICAQLRPTLCTTSPGSARYAGKAEAQDRPRHQRRHCTLAQLCTALAPTLPEFRQRPIMGIPITPPGQPRHALTPTLPKRELAVCSEKTTSATHIQTLTHHTSDHHQPPFFGCHCCGFGGYPLQNGFCAR